MGIVDLETEAEAVIDRVTIEVREEVVEGDPLILTLCEFELLAESDESTVRVGVDENEGYEGEVEGEAEDEPESEEEPVLD